MAVNIVQSALASRRLTKWMPWVGMTVLVAGVAAILIVYFGNTADNPPANPSGPAIKSAAPPKQIAFPNEAWKVAQEFLFTAVARKNLARSYAISDSALRGGLTLKQWKTGTITVPFFPVAHVVKTNWKNSNYAYPREAMMNVVLVANPATGQKPLSGQIVLKKVGNGAGARWVVDYFQPLGGPPVPSPK